METKGIKHTYFVSFDHTQGDHPILLVGEPDPKTQMINIVSAFTDQEAVDIYLKLADIK